MKVKINIEDIRNCILKDKLEITQHCRKRLLERNLSVEDIKTCIMNGEIISEYNDTKPWPCVLIFGFCIDNKIIHSVVGYSGEEATVITAYIPSLDKFESDLKTRKKE